MLLASGVVPHPFPPPSPPPLLLAFPGAADGGLDGRPERGAALWAFKDRLAALVPLLAVLIATWAAEVLPPAVFVGLAALLAVRSLLLLLAARVLGLRHLLQMGWFTAPPVTAEVVKHEAGDEFVPSEHPCDAVRADRLPAVPPSTGREFDGHRPVAAAVARTRPFKAPGIRSDASGVQLLGGVGMVSDVERKRMHGAHSNADILAWVHSEWAPPEPEPEP